MECTATIEKLCRHAPRHATATRECEYEWQCAQNKNRPFPAGFRAPAPETDRVNNLAACAMRLFFLHMEINLSPLLFGRISH